MPVKTPKHVMIKGRFRTLKRVNTVHTPDYLEDLDTYINESTKQVERTNSSSSLSESFKMENFDPPEGVLGSGRRGAMIAGKNYIEDSTEVNSVQNMDQERKGSKIGPEVEFKRSSIELGMQLIPGVVTLKEQHHKKTLKRQQTISEISMRPGILTTSQFHSEERKKGLSFLKLIDKKGKSRETVLDLQEALCQNKKSNFRDSYLASFKEIHWSDLIPHNESSVSSPKISNVEKLRREAVWELFKCELNFLLEHLMVLKHCFMEPLKKLQVDGHLMFVEPDDLFGNLDELCYVSYTFCRDFITTLTREMTPDEFGQTSVLVKTFLRWSQHSRNGDVFHSYCLNYENAMAYLESLRKNEQFTEFEKWCNKDERLQRLQLTDLLVAPMQHCTKMPLLLSHIRKYTIEPSEQTLLTDTLQKTENYLRSLDEKIMWLRNYERLQEIQHQLQWSPITEMEPRVFIPEFLKHILSRQPCERLVANPKRQLLHEGHILLNEGNKVLDMYLFLFDDILILTKIKKLPKKMMLQQQQNSSGFTEQPSMGDCDCFCGSQRPFSDTSGGVGMMGSGGCGSMAGNLRSPTEGAVFHVYKQPLALDRFSLHDVGTSEALANGIKHAFVVIHVSRFQQVIGVYTFQATSELSKAVWMDELSQSQQNFQEKLKEKLQNQDFLSPRTNKHSKILGGISRQLSDSTNTNNEQQKPLYGSQLNPQQQQQMSQDQQDAQYRSNDGVLRGRADLITIKDPNGDGEANSEDYDRRAVNLTGKYFQYQYSSNLNSCGGATGGIEDGDRISNFIDDDDDDIQRRRKEKEKANAADILNRQKNDSGINNDNNNAAGTNNNDNDNSKKKEYDWGRRLKYPSHHQAESTSGPSTDPSTKMTVLSSSIDMTANMTIGGGVRKANVPTTISISSESYCPGIGPTYSGMGSPRGICILPPPYGGPSQAGGSSQPLPQPPKDLSFLTNIIPFTPPLSPTLHQDFPSLPCGELESSLERMLATETIEQTDCRGRSYSEPIPSPSEPRNISILPPSMVGESTTTLCPPGRSTSVNVPRSEDFRFGGTGGTVTMATIHCSTSSEQDKRLLSQRCDSHGSNDSQTTVKEQMEAEYNQAHLT